MSVGNHLLVLDLRNVARGRQRVNLSILKKAIDA